MSDTKPIRVDNEADFERLRARIDIEVSHARHHWNLLRELETATAEYWLEMSESNTFWSLTFIAHRDSVLAHLGRVFDKDTGSLSLGRFIETVRANRIYFSDDAFRKRLQGNHDVESLVKHRPIDDVAIDADLKTVSASDPLVKQLHSLRNKVIAHTDADAVKRGAPEAHKRWLPANEIDTLLRRASEITTKYSIYYGASCSGGIAGADDFKHTLALVRKARLAHQAEIEEQLRRAQNPPSGLDNGQPGPG